MARAAGFICPDIGGRKHQGERETKRVAVIVNQEIPDQTLYRSGQVMDPGKSVEPEVTRARERLRPTVCLTTPETNRVPDNSPTNRIQRKSQTRPSGIPQRTNELHKTRHITVTTLSADQVFQTRPQILEPSSRRHAPTPSY